MVGQGGLVRGRRPWILQEHFHPNRPGESGTRLSRRMSAFTYRAGKLDQTLYLSLDPALGYYLLLEYTDRSRIYATAAVPAGPGPGLIWWGGERIELPAERFVSSAEAHRAIAWFLETGDADPDTNWELF